MSQAAGKVFVSKAPLFCLRRDFLHPGVVAELLAFAEAQQAAFVPTKVGFQDSGAVDPKSRISLVYPRPAPLIDGLGRQLSGLSGVVCELLGLPGFTAAGVEIELVAHGEGAFYGRHSDVRVPNAQGLTRRLSGVYYFHAQPKGFDGGELRIYSAGGPGQGPAADVDPVHNTCVFFPPSLPHEVRPVRCPSRRFMDSRFALNLWYMGS